MVNVEALHEIKRVAKKVSELADALEPASFSYEGSDASYSLDVRPSLLSGVLSSWARLLSNSFVQNTYAEQREGFWLTPKLLERIDKISEQVRTGAISHRILNENGVARELLSLLNYVLRQFGSYEPGVSAYAPEAILNLMYRLQQDFDVLTSRDKREEIEETATKVSEAAGTTGQNAMAKFFDELAEAEKDTAGKFRFATIALMIFGGMVAAILVFAPSVGGSDYVHLVQRLVVTGAIFALAGYLAKQANHHRSVGNWAGALAVQLKTFEAYMDPIGSESVRDALRTSFAVRAFGEPNFGKGDSPSESTASPIAEKLFELLSRSQSKG
ncbi:hypothetical protein J2W21_003025 [Sinomonas atrocyanea]|uniref:hypothetical protein n=1 Tax=Sinomonas atrocyanea TaxID=37927 RepID=UPI00277FFFF3|nr:hypothetical protein [Sinomonas atrocyanea]MDP9885502.1 hypothetical protein [Sinomonas atrocyanea]